MTKATRWGAVDTFRENRFAEVVGVLVMALIVFLVSAPEVALGDSDVDHKEKGGFCTATARAVFEACGHDVRSDYAIARAICINVSDDAERSQCLAEARVARREGNQLCRDQLAARRGACDVLGEGRYDPPFDAADFDADFHHPTSPNAYFPLGIGYRWEYRGGSERNVVEILDRTKLIDGVNCVVANDQVFKNDELVEDTDDWFAQKKDGNVWYCGEEVKDYESFDGDNPRLPELVSIDGSFKQGRNGDKAGLFFQASPEKGQTYIEEFSLGNAEDVTEILSTTYAFGDDPTLDEFVPQQVVELLCAGDCVVTKNFSLLEPGIFARKYYARGIGVFLEVMPEGPEVVQLVSCSFDPRCATLPVP